MPSMSYFSTAKQVEAIVRAEGATPATVGVIEGKVHVGLSSEELERLAICQGSLKVSHRDLPHVTSKVRPQDAPRKMTSQPTMSPSSDFWFAVLFLSGSHWGHDGVGHHDGSTSSWHPRVRHRGHRRGPQGRREQ